MSRAKSPLDKAKAYEVVWPAVCRIFDWARSMEAPSFVYFIGEENEGPIKVGLAKDPIARLRTMQTGNPRRLKLEAVLVGDRRLERLLHDLWEGFAIHGAASDGKKGSAPGTEWFQPEVREACLPIIATAEGMFLTSEEADESPFTMSEHAVRHAHIEHDFVAAGRDHTYLLGASGGYVVSRPSTIPLTG